MATGRNQFIGSAGQYFVAYGLTAREIHASITIGNAPYVDVLCAAPGGERALSIQVKTANSAAKNSYGEVGFNWDVGLAAAGHYSRNLWYAFVDLQCGRLTPNVYFVPSKWVGMFVEKTFSRGVFYLKKSVADKVVNKWDFVRRYLEGDQEIEAWADSLDPDFRWWGTKDGLTSAQLEDALRHGAFLDSNNTLVRT